jgi:voltage-gated sodium channel
MRGGRSGAVANRAQRGSQVYPDSSDEEEVLNEIKDELGILPAHGRTVPTDSDHGRATTLGKVTRDANGKTVFERKVGVSKPGHMDGAALVADAEESMENRSGLRRHAHVLIESSGFNGVVGLIIAANALYIGAETDNPQWADNPEYAKAMMGVELFFTAAFSVELFIRLFADGVRTLKDPWGAFDCFLVIVSVVDNLVSFTNIFGSEQSPLQASAGLRSLRVVRVARLFRAFRFVKELRLLVGGILSALRAIGSAWILLLVIMYIFAVIGVRLTLDYRMAAPEDEYIEDHFGGVFRAMLTFFQIMTTEGWCTIARHLMPSDRSPTLVILIMLFLTITTYAFMNVVVAVIVENTLDQAVLLKEPVVDKVKREQRGALEKTWEIFKAADSSGDGLLTKKEFLAAMSLPRVMKYFHEVDINVADVEGLFDILDVDESGVLSPEEFIEGCVRARGEARNKEVMKLQCELWRMYRGIRDLLVDLDKKIGNGSGSIVLVKPSELDDEGEVDSPQMSPKPLVKAKHVAGIVRVAAAPAADEAERAAGGPSLSRAPELSSEAVQWFEGRMQSFHEELVGMQDEWLQRIANIGARLQPE